MNVLIHQCRQYLGEEVTIRGWLVHKRSSGQVRFLILRDGTGILQAILLKNKIPTEIFQAFDQLTLETSLFVTGILHDDFRAPQGVELEVKSFSVFQFTPEYSFSPKGTAFLMEHRHLWLCSARQQAILWIRHELSRAVRDFLGSNHCPVTLTA